MLYRIALNIPGNTKQNKMTLKSVLFTIKAAGSMHIFCKVNLQGMFVCFYQTMSQEPCIQTSFARGKSANASLSLSSSYSLSGSSSSTEVFLCAVFKSNIGTRVLMGN